FQIELIFLKCKLKTISNGVWILKWPLHFTDPVNPGENYDLWAITIVIFGVVLFDFATNFISGPVKAYVFDVCSYINKERGLHYHTLLTRLGGAFGYLVGAMDWGHSSLGRLLGSEYQVIYFFSALTWTVFFIVHLFSIQETPLVKNCSLDSLPPNARLITHSSSGGYGSLHGSMSKELEPDLRPRSFSALTEVCHRHRKEITLKSCLLAMINILSHYRCLCIVYKGNLYADHNSTYQSTYRVKMKSPSLSSFSLSTSDVSSDVQRLLQPFVDLKGLYFVGYFVFGLGISLISLIPNIITTLILSSESCPAPCTPYPSTSSQSTIGKRSSVQRNLGKGNLAGQDRGTGMDCAALTCMMQSVIVVVLFTSTMSLLGCLFIALHIRYVE
uniref:Solute carrier family 45 member 2 n=1 Tax=Oncorhynchus tshawytscha TaxID=74940 RepID=A0A8C8K060_ONCTS